MTLHSIMGLTCLTYNSLEYLKLFLLSYEKFAPEYKLVMVVDGSTDGTKEFVVGYPNSNVSFIVFDSNRGQPDSFNSALKSIRESSCLNYVCILNDDMVFSPNWDVGLEDKLRTVSTVDYLSLNLSEPISGGSFPLKYSCFHPDKFDFDSWIEFSVSEEAMKMADSTSSGTPGFPLIMSTKLLDDVHFDPIYRGGGVLDTDFRLQLFLLGAHSFPMKRNFLFHFSGGSTNKIKAAGKWVNFGGPGNPFCRKWGVDIGEAGGVIIGISSFSKEQVVSLSKINSGIYQSENWKNYWRSLPTSNIQGGVSYENHNV